MVELLVGIVIAGFILLAVTTMVYQVITLNGASMNRMTAVKQVENAIQRFSPDVQMAQRILPDPDPLVPEELLNLSWVLWDNSRHDVTYKLATMSGTAMQLEREYYKYTSDGNLLETDTAVVGRYIDPDSGLTNFTLTDGVLHYKITATVDGAQPAIETRSGQIVPRPAQ